MQALKQQIKTMIVESLMLEDVTPDEIEDDAPLFGGGLDLDSVDALEIAVEVERLFGVRIPDTAEARDVFRSVATLAEYVAKQRDGEG